MLASGKATLGCFKVWEIFVMSGFVRILRLVVKLSVPVALVSCSSDKSAQIEDVQGQLVLSGSDMGSTVTATVGQQMVRLQRSGQGNPHTFDIV